MRLGGGEVIVHGHDVAGLDEGLGQQMFSGAALVGREKVFVTEDLTHRVEQPVEALRTGVGVVGLHHRGLLIVGHGIGAAIGKHVEKNVARAKEEGVVTCLFHCLETFTGGCQPRLLNNAHFVHFDRDFGSVG